MKKHKWWEKTFNKDYYNTTLSELPDERTNGEVNFIARAARLNTKLSILDLCCGHGRHSLELAKRGYHVTGFDYSKFYIDIARKNAKHARTSVDYIRGDIRKLHFHDRFDIILSLFTSLGYFSDKENEAVLDNITNALKPKGFFLLDTMNAHLLFEEIRNNGKRIKPHVYKRSQIRHVGDFVFKEQDIYEVKTQRVHFKRTWSNKNTKGIYEYHIKHYTIDQLSEMLQKKNYSIITTWGDYKGHKWTQSNWRTIILAQKKGRHPLFTYPLNFLKKWYYRFAYRL